MVKEVRPIFSARKLDKQAEALLIAQGAHPLLARLYASRGVRKVEDVKGDLSTLLPYSGMLNCVAMAKKLADIYERQERVLIVSDYDCDGATACSVLIAAFEAAGLNFGYLVPDRMKHGYGLTPSIVEEAAELPQKPAYIITVDNGISSVAGVNRAKELGIEVLVTDHHLPPAVLPKALCIVNPNQEGDTFESKHIAGCGVAWYVAWALCDELEARGHLVALDPAYLLSYVALGTVADVVQLDKNNRTLVSEGLERIRSGDCPVGISVLAQVSGKRAEQLTTTDIGFGLGPRINAAGRLTHMSTGIECLTAHTEQVALARATQLDAINKERKATQAGILDEALAQLHLKAAEGKNSIVAYSDSWHEGVIGVVAGRIKEQNHRPTFILCNDQEGNIKGSGRSIPGFHLKHALDAIEAKHPGILLKFGGHAMAAGLTIRADKLQQFIEAFEAEAAKIDPELLVKRIEHDGFFDAKHLDIEVIEMLQAQVWGQGFPEPLFFNRVAVKGARTMGETDAHLKFRAALGYRSLDVVAFGKGHLIEMLPDTLTIAHKVSVNEYQGNKAIQLMADAFKEDLLATAEA